MKTYVPPHPEHSMVMESKLRGEEDVTTNPKMPNGVSAVIDSAGISSRETEFQNLGFKTE